VVVRAPRPRLAVDVWPEQATSLHGDLILQEVLPAKPGATLEDDDA
jgi:hypothetical protein